MMNAVEPRLEVKKSFLSATRQYWVTKTILLKFFNLFNISLVFYPQLIFRLMKGFEFVTIQGQFMIKDLYDNSS